MRAWKLLKPCQRCFDCLFQVNDRGLLGLQVVTHEIPVRGNLRGICTKVEAPQEVPFLSRTPTIHYHYQTSDPINLDRHAPPPFKDVSANQHRLPCKFSTYRGCANEERRRIVDTPPPPGTAHLTQSRALHILYLVDWIADDYYQKPPLPLLLLPDFSSYLFRRVAGCRPDRGMPTTEPRGPSQRPDHFRDPFRPLAPRRSFPPPFNHPPQRRPPLRRRDRTDVSRDILGQ
jgi:hypothetical protein